MKLVADSSAFLAVALSEPEREDIVRATRGAEVVAPELLPYEIGNALSAMVRRGRLGSDEALEVHRSIARIPCRLIAIDIAESLALAFRFQLYAYDAYFLQCAKTMSCPLLTLDKKMQGVAAELGIELLEKSP
jgi:predicted nucleic acid-binding protein